MTKIVFESTASVTSAYLNLFSNSPNLKVIDLSGAPNMIGGFLNYNTNYPSYSNLPGITEVKIGNYKNAAATEGQLIFADNIDHIENQAFKGLSTVTKLDLSEATKLGGI